MSSIIMKHSMLPIPDLVIDYEIDSQNQLVRANLSHVDSRLLLSFAQYLEREHPGLRLIDSASQARIGQARIKGMHNMEVSVFGLTLWACFTQVLRLSEAQPEEFTVSLHPIRK